MTEAGDSLRHVHLIPAGDRYRHHCSVHCWCEPSPDAAEPDVWVHHRVGEPADSRAVRQPHSLH